MPNTPNLNAVQLGSEQDFNKVAVLNALTTLFDKAIAGFVGVANGDANYTLTSDEASQPVIKFTSTLTAARTHKIPVTALTTGRNRIILIWNATGGGFKITVLTTAGGSTGIDIANGSVRLLWHDGTNVYAIGPEANPTTGVSNSGTAFPSGPATNSRFFRTDRGIEYFYDGTRWLSVQVFSDAMPAVAGALPYAATVASAERISAPWAGIYDLWLVEFQFGFIVIGGTALGASHKWVTVLEKITAAATVTTLATVNIDSGASDTFRTSVVPIAALLGVTNLTFRVNHTKTGTPGTLTSTPRIIYRLVG